MVSCFKNISEADVNKQIFEKTKAYEINEYEFKNLDISYDVFKEKMKDIVVDLNYLDDEVILRYSSQSFHLAKDLSGLTLEEINVIREDVENDWRKHYEEKGWDYDKRDEKNEKISIEIKFTDVYDYEDHNWKYVYSQTHYNAYNEKNFEGYINKRYRFVEENGVWKILQVDFGTLNWSDFKKEYGTKEELLIRTPYQTFTNEPVEYIESFMLKESK